MVGSAGVLRRIPAGHRGREGRRRQNDGDRRAGRARPPRRACATLDRRGRGQERPRPRCSAASALALRRGRRCSRAAGPTARPRSGPARSPPTTRCSSTSTTTACAGSRSGSCASGALDVVATAAPGIKDILVLGKVKQLERARRGRPDRARRARRRATPSRSSLSARGLLDAVHGRARSTPRPRDVLELLTDPDRCQVRARDPARGDTGQRAGRDRVPPRGPRRRRASARWSSTASTPSSPASTPTPTTAAEAAGAALAPGEAEALRAAADVPRATASTLQDEQLGAARRAAAAAAAPAARSCSRRPRARRGRRARRRAARRASRAARRRVADA